MKHRGLKTTSAVAALAALAVLCLPRATTFAQTAGDIIHALSALTNGELLQGNGGKSISSSGVTVDVAGTAGAALDNAGTSTELSRADHEHLIPWSTGLVFTATPTASTTDTKHMLVNFGCEATNIDVTKLSVSADTQGSGALTLNIERFNAAGTTQGDLFAADPSYSNTGDDRQDFTPDQNNNNIAATDYFKTKWGSSVNGQDEITVLVQGKCRTS